MPAELFTLYGCGVGGCVVALLGMAIGSQGYRNHEAANSCLMITLYLIVIPAIVGLALLLCGSIQGAFACFVTVILAGAMWLAGAMLYLVFIV